MRSFVVRVGSAARRRKSSYPRSRNRRNSSGVATRNGCFVSSAIGARLATVGFSLRLRATERPARHDETATFRHVRWRRVLGSQWERVRAARADILTTRVRADELAASVSAARAELGAMRTAVAELAQRTAAEHSRTIEALAESGAELAATW